MNMNIEAAEKRIGIHGPDRVVVDGEGYAVKPSLAAMANITPEIIFIRNDGWSLGAPENLQHVAFPLWRNEWVAFMRKGEKEAHPIEEYHGI